MTQAASDRAGRLSTRYSKSRCAKLLFAASGAQRACSTARSSPRRARHLLGTNILGEDVLYNALKGVRTAFIIGIVPSVIAAFFAILFGLLAGFYGGWVDDVIQYVYQVLSSIPGILLLIAMLMVMERGLWQLCMALGVTSWVGLCRLIRGETLKVKQHGVCGGCPRPGGERRPAPLPPDTAERDVPRDHRDDPRFLRALSCRRQCSPISAWASSRAPGAGGRMIMSADRELPNGIWWNLTGASVLLFLLVLAFNLFADALRDALDPRLRTG